MDIIQAPHPTKAVPDQQLPPKDAHQNQINVFELTLLLKVMGFRLNYLDYEEAPAEKATTPDITIEIKCGKRNIVSRLSATGDQCSCPAKKEENGNDSSFWEILGTAPSSSPGKQKVEETSSNLLPALSKRGLNNTKHLLGLIFEGFHKDHLPTATTTNSPEDNQRPNSNFLTSTVKSPRRLVPVLNADLLMHDVLSPSLLTVPPNTPKVLTGPGLLSGQGSKPNLVSFRNRDHMVYLEVMAAKERLDKALLAMKFNIAEDLGNYHGPAMDLTAHKIFEEGETESPGAKPNGMSPATFKRRSSLGAFPNIKSRIDPEAKKKAMMVRNKSSIDAGAATKAKAAVTSRYLQPKKPVTASTGVEKKKSPLGNKKILTASPKPPAKRSPATVGLGSWK